MGVVKIIAYLDGKETDEIRNLDQIEIDTSFISDIRNTDTAQPAITINELNFVGGAARTIINYQLGGLTGASVGIMEGLPLTLWANDGINNEKIFDGFLDFKKYEQINEGEVVCGLKEVGSMNSFDAISKVTYFNILESKGVFSQSDYTNVKYIIERVDAEAEAASAAISLFILSIQLAQQARNIEKDLADFVAHTTGGVPGLIAGPIYLAVILIIDLALFALLSIQIIKLSKKLVELLAPPKRNHKSIFLKKLFEKSLNHLGYSFETNITEMDNTVYLPARPDQKVKDIKSGVPKVGQPGQTLAEIIGIVLKKYDAQFAIIGSVAHIRSVNDPFWIQNSTYILPDWGSDDVTAVNLESESKIFNINDFNSSIKISFASDGNDAYTISSWKGTSFVVSTEEINVNDPKKLLFEGLDEVNIPISLGVRKDVLSEVEIVLFQLLSIADSVINFFVGAVNLILALIPGTNTLSKSNLAGSIADRIGALKLSQSSFNNPKFIWLELNSKGVFSIPFNHRDKLSARVVYVKYHARKSFVNTTPLLNVISTDDVKINYEDINTPNYGNQKRLFDDNLMGFGITDYLKLKINSYFATFDGKNGRIEKSKWLIEIHKASQSYSIEEIWTKNLVESFIEPV